MKTSFSNCFPTTASTTVQIQNDSPAGVRWLMSPCCILWFVYFTIFGGVMISWWRSICSLKSWMWTDPNVWALTYSIQNRLYWYHSSSEACVSPSWMPPWCHWPLAANAREESASKHKQINCCFAYEASCGAFSICACSSSSSSFWKYCHGVNFASDGL